MRTGPFAATMVAAFCVAGVAMGTTPIKPDDIAGRWVSSKEWISYDQELTLDISRCGTGWCGVEVVNGSTCGRTVLRLDQGPRSEGPIVEFVGRIERAPGTQAFVIRADIHRAAGTLRMKMFGNTGDEFQFWRRNYPFQYLLSRAGDAVCAPDAKVS